MSSLPMSACAPAVPLPRRDAWTPRVVALLAIAFYATVCAPIPPYSMRHDFLAFYAGAAAARAGDFTKLYPFAHQAQRQNAIVPGIVNVAPFVRPPFYAAALAPLSALPLPAAFAVWGAVQVALLLWMWRWAWRAFGPESLVFASLFLPTAYGIAHGQDCVFIAAVLLAAWVAIERGHDRVAGAIAAIALVKFHLVLLLAPAMFVRKRWGMLAAFAGAAALEVAISVALIGPAGVREYLDLLTDPSVSAVVASPERMVNVRALLVNLRMHVWWTEAFAIMAVLVAALRAVKRATDDWVWYWTALAASILVNPHSYEYDAALLLPALLASIFRSAARPLRIAAATAAIPAPYLLTLFGEPWAIAPSLVLMVWFAMMVRHRCATMASI